ncbi:MAG: GGDEF domain-containing protein [Pseudomonadota bacterium]
MLYQPVPYYLLFKPWSTATRPVFGTYLALFLIAVPSGMLTRIFEWTGIPVQLGRLDIHLTLYLPLLICVPLTLWLGYLWGAIPAYLSTFCVSLLGGMPLPWIFVFSLSNPVGLAVLALIYRSTPLRTDLRGANGLPGFTLAIFVASLAGSAGSFIWAHTNQVGLNEFFPVWQGWWLGGFLQGLVLTAPILALTTPFVLARLEAGGLRQADREPPSRRFLLAAMSTTIVLIAAFAFVVRAFSLSIASEAMATIDDPATRGGLETAIEGLSLPYWIIILVITLAAFFAYQAIVHWTARIRVANEILSERAEALHRASITDSLTGVGNRGWFFREAEESLAERAGTQFTLLVMDLDHFKNINDRYGHPTGDAALVAFAQGAATLLRSADALFGRIGGEEFAALLGGRDPAADAATAEALRAMTEAIELEMAGERVPVTVSIGSAGRAEPTESIDHLYARADAALLVAKRRGRNRLSTARAEDPSTDAGARSQARS